MLIFLYLILMNALGFVLMLVDKYKAKKNLWRIRESTLFLVAVLGGSLGCWLGMYAARHKTRHPSYTLVIPAILLAQTVAGIWLFKK